MVPTSNATTPATPLVTFQAEKGLYIDPCANQQPHPSSSAMVAKGGKRQLRPWVPTKGSPGHNLNRRIQQGLGRVPGPTADSWGVGQVLQVPTQQHLGAPGGHQCPTAFPNRGQEPCGPHQDRQHDSRVIYKQTLTARVQGYL